MAKIRSFTRVAGTSKSHPTEVDAEWSIVELTPGRLLQISTYGSDRRKTGGVSQTIQLDEERARALKEAIAETFPNL